MTEDTEHVTIELQAEGVDIDALVNGIREDVRQKREEGFYNDARIGRAERHNLMYMADSGELLRFYLNCLSDGVHVDVNDFAIEDKRKGLQGRLLAAFKTVIWKLLKFYTYRLWHQQNQINGLMMTAINSSFKQYEKKIGELEDRLSALEGGDKP